MGRLTTLFPVHHRACPLGAELLPAPLIGAILDGDATATVRSFEGRAPRPRVTVGARDDSPLPFALAASVARHRGAPLGWMRRRADLRRNEWVIERPDQLVDLLAWIDAVAPPLAPRLAATLGIVGEAASLLATWLAPDPAALAGLAHRASVLNRTAEPREAPPALVAADENRIWWEVAGLLASDGYLAIRDRRARMAPVVEIVQRADNTALLEILRRRTYIGSLVVRGSQVAWRIARATDRGALVEGIRAHPLPLSSPRREQFEIWASASAERARSRRRDERLVDLADALRAARLYRGPRLLCSCPMPGVEQNGVREHQE